MFTRSCIVLLLLFSSCAHYPQEDSKQGSLFKPHALKHQKLALKELIALRKLPQVPMRKEHNLSILKNDYHKQPVGLLSGQGAGHYLIHWSAHFPKAFKEDWQLMTHQYRKPWTFKYQYQKKGTHKKNWKERFTLTGETYLQNSDTFAKLWVKSLQSLFKDKKQLQVFTEYASPQETFVTLQSSLPKKGSKTTFVRFVKASNSLLIFKYENRESFLPSRKFHYWKKALKDMKVQETHLLKVDAECAALIQQYYGTEVLKQ